MEIPGGFPQPLSGGREGSGPLPSPCSSGSRKSPELLAARLHALSPPGTKAFAMYGRTKHGVLGAAGESVKEGRKRKRGRRGGARIRLLPVLIIFSLTTHLCGGGAPFLLLSETPAGRGGVREGLCSVQSPSRAPRPTQTREHAARTCSEYSKQTRNGRPHGCTFIAALLQRPSHNKNTRQHQIRRRTVSNIQQVKHMARLNPSVTCFTKSYL